MLAEYKAKANVGMCVGLGVQLASRLIVADQLHPSLDLMATGFGVVVFIYGYRCYVLGNGYAVAWGWFGLLSCLLLGYAAARGHVEVASLLVLVVLALFPDRHRDGGPPPTYPLPPAPKRST